jgi:uncharacterized protein (TIGR03435 family)
VSIKPNKSGAEQSSWRSMQDGIQITNMPLHSLLMSAFGITLESQIVGLPGWVESDPYDVEAKMDPNAVEAAKKLSGKERWEQQRLMMQSMLIERCQLKVHHETREMPVYDLVIAKGGLKMKEAVANEKGFGMYKGDEIQARATSVSNLLFSLSGTVGRLIVDKTGLGDKKFDFDLKWTPDDQRAADSAADAGPSIFTALEEQLGLKLVPDKGPVEVLVIDHMERPSVN